MQNLPNKLTLVAAAIHAIAVQESNDDLKAPKVALKPLWRNLSDAEKTPLNKASEFLAQYTHGTALETINRAELAAKFEKVCPDIKANANTVVELFLNIYSVMV